MSGDVTYDPIVESRELAPVRLQQPLRSPELGHALVLVPRVGEAYVVPHGGTVPGAWAGTYRYSYLVDVTEHQLTLELPLLSKDPGFAFRASVRLMARVHDPVEVVSRGIRDVSAAIRDYTKWLLRQVSRNYDIAMFHDAEHALNTTVRSFTGDAVIRLRDVRVELLVDDDEAVAYRDLDQESRLSSKQRYRHLEMMRREGAEGLLAEIIEAEGPEVALNWIASAEVAEREELIRALNTVLNHADPHREPLDLLNAERSVLDRLMDGSTAPFGRTRPSRVRGAIPAETEESHTHGQGREVEGGARDTDGREDSGRVTQRYGTVRDTVFNAPESEQPAERPEDEHEGRTDRSEPVQLHSPGEAQEGRLDDVASETRLRQLRANLDRMRTDHAERARILSLAADAVTDDLPTGDLPDDE